MNEELLPGINNDGAVSTLRQLSKVSSLILFGVVSACAVLAIGITSATGQALENFIKKSGPARSIEPIAMVKEDRWAVSFTSQDWKKKPWTHTLLAVEPTTISDKSTVLLYIAGSKDVAKYGPLLETIAEESGIICAVVGSVPNQPMFDRSEDALLAYSFEQYRKTGAESWPVLFPMVNTVVKAIDVLQGQMESRYAVKKIRVVVAGASKRGWTSYLAPLVDKRIVATAPAVFDFLNFPEQIQRARTAYGKDSEKIKNYTELGLTDRLAEPRIEKLQMWIDPFQYRERLTVPKLALLGANDPYWVVDSMEAYWKELEGDKIALMLPNVGHDVMDTDEAQLQLAHFLRVISLKDKMPWLTWNISQGDIEASVYATASTAIKSATKWIADSPTRDFRTARWNPTGIKALSADAGVVSSTIALPSKGFRAFFVTVEVETAGGPLRLSTAPKVLERVEEKGKAKDSVTKSSR